MPSGYLHKRCAHEAAKMAGIMVTEGDCLTLGAQGPDPLFMLGMFPLRPSSKPLAYGKILHTKKTGPFLCTLLRHARDGGEKERAFAMGFLTHYALDSIVHPYVYAMSMKKGRYSSTLHLLLENRWDALYARRDGEKTVPMSMPDLTASKGDWEPIAQMWAEAAKEVYPKSGLTKALILEALHGAERVNRLTYTPHGVKYCLLYLLERLLGKPGLLTAHMTQRFLPRRDLENNSHTPWHSQVEPNRPRQESLPDLLQLAIKRAAELLTAAAAYYARDINDAALSAIIGSVRYDTCTPCV